MRCTRRRGISLIELMIAIGLLASGFLMVIGMFPTGLMALKKSEGVVLATDLAQRELERVKTTDYDAMSSYQVQEELILTASGTSITRRFTCAVQADTELVAGRLREVVVMVSWLEGGQVRYVKMGTLVNKSLL